MCASAKACIAEQTLLPVHRYCSGPAVSGPLLRPDEVAANVSVFPQWLVDTSSGLQDALVQIAGFSLNLKPGVREGGAGRLIGSSIPG
jgi:hypothetical protein